MITPLSYDLIKRNHCLEFASQPKVTLYGGLPIFIAFMRKCKVRERLEAQLESAQAKAILQVMLGIFVGARSMEEIANACQDKIVKDYIVNPVCETQIVRILKSLSLQQVQDLHDFTLSLALLDITSEAYRGIFQTIDVDSTAVEKYGRQEGVEYGYLEPDKIERCYQYLLFRNDFLNTLLYGTIRGGAAHSQNNFSGYLHVILPMFNTNWSLRIRADSGFFSEEAFHICGENQVFLFVKAPMIEARKRLAMSDSLMWSSPPSDWEDDTQGEYASYKTNTAKGWEWVENFKRVKDDSEGSGYRYSCVATNDVDKKPWEAYAFYNGRARVENDICELKNDYALGKIVTQSFQVNDIITQATLTLFMLVNTFKRNCLDKKDRNKRLGTLRQMIFSVPAEILRSGRREWYRIYNNHFDGLSYSRILARIDGLRVLLSLIPILDTS